MTLTSSYDALRHFADSYALVVMAGVFLILGAWPFRPGASAHNDRAAHTIFEGDDQ